MDIETLRTFLEITRTRHFGRAAENLCVTQSAVSARIRQLEDRLRTPLFYRTRNNIQLTAAGNRLIPHAEHIVTRWVRVQQQISAPEDSKTLLSVSGTSSLWNVLLQRWLERVYSQRKDVALQVDVQSSDSQVRRLVERTLDFAFSFETPSIHELTVQEVAAIQLVMVCAKADQQVADVIKDRYVIVDWGTSFASAHAEYFPDIPPPVLRVGLGRIAQSFILNQGGAAYLDQSAIETELNKGKLFAVKDAPTFERYVYAIYRTDNERVKDIRELCNLVEGPDTHS